MSDTDELLSRSVICPGCGGETTRRYTLTPIQGVEGAAPAETLYDVLGPRGGQHTETECLRIRVGALKAQVESLTMENERLAEGMRGLIRGLRKRERLLDEHKAKEMRSLGRLLDKARSVVRKWNGKKS